MDPRTALLLGWAVLSSLLLGLVAWVFLRLRCIRVACVAAEVDGVPVRVAERIGPAVLGLVRPVVVLPRWALYVPEEERRLILLHEREHIAGGDAWLLFLSTLALVAMPWSLPLWWQHRRLRDALEIDCDARVLARGASRRLYGQILVRTAGCGSRLPLLSPAWGESSSQLRERIMSMTARRPRHRLLRAIPLSALALGVTLAACAVADGDLSPAGPRRSDAPVPPAPTPAPHAPAAPDVDTLRVSRGDPGHGTLGFSYGMTAPIQLRDGEPLPTRTPTYWVVRGVKDGSSALRAGLQAGDTVLAINGIDGRELSAWQSVQRRAPGTPFTLLVRRGTRTLEIAAELDPPRVSGEGR